ncbi:MAG: EAL domain-containing protein [Sulfuricella sp.]|nr:EAL domain-containing protein [Sulfuricella sp.]
MNAILKEEFNVLEHAHRLARPTPAAAALHPHELLDILLNRRFGVEYQPVVDTVSGETEGYEALARFYRANGEAVPPNLVFEMLHENPLLLFHTELELKKLQIMHAPKTELLFLNLDPDSFHVGGTPGGNVFTELFRGSRCPGQEIMIEVIENLHIRDVARANAMITDFKNADIKVATDDLGVSNGLVSFGSFCDSSFIKFDRAWLRERGNRKFAVLEWFHGMAKAAGARTVLEGVETLGDLALAHDIGFDCVQGFYFRERFVNEAWGRP